MSRLLCLAEVGLLVLLAAAPARAMFALPSLAPIDRLIENTEAFIEKNPEDPQGPYTLGRLHYLAVVVKGNQVPTYGRPAEAAAKLPSLPGRGDINMFRHGWLRDPAISEALVREVEERADAVADRDRDPDAWRAARDAAFYDKNFRDWLPPDMRLEQAEVDQHARQGLHQLSRAIQMQPETAVYHLTRASLIETYAARGGELGLSPDPDAAAQTQPTTTPATQPAEEAASLRREWLDAAMTEYAEAFRLARAEEVAMKTQTIKGIDVLVGFESIERYRALADTLGEAAGDAEVLEAMNEHMARLEGLPPSPIVTPIIFSLTPNRALPDLLGTGFRVMFDLDGDGRAESRPWVKPDTGILVWDPHGTGRITSGRQLFGNVTWWMFWRDGYAALEALDDDRDGELAGEELLGLAVWFDRDGDAVSDAGEVTPVADLAIVGISARVGRVEEGTPMNRHGLRLQSGTLLPTWDWIAE